MSAGRTPWWQAKQRAEVARKASRLLLDPKFREALLWGANREAAPIVAFLPDDTTYYLVRQIAKHSDGANVVVDDGRRIIVLNVTETHTFDYPEGMTHEN